MSYKLLYIAYHCGPGRGSEWGLGWHYVAELARTQPVWVITHADNREIIEPYLREHPTPQPVHVHYVKLPAALAWLGDNRRYSLFNLHYYLWQFAAARVARQVHRTIKLDLVQHVSLFRWWMPSAGASLVKDGVGFIFGPVGGGEIMPGGFRKNMPISARWSDALRWIARTIWRHDPVLKKCIRSAHLLIAGTDACASWFRRYGGKNIAVHCAAIAGATEIQQAATDARAARPTDQPFTFASCGGLSYYRGVDLAIRAFARANLPNARYVHYCDGAFRRKIIDLARQLGISHQVHLTGDIPHLDCVRGVAQADACVHTVLRDSQGLVAEAMIAGVPVITFDHLTPGMMVTPECGVKIPIDNRSTPDELVEKIAQVMRNWHDNPQKLRELANAATQRGKLFTVDAKSEQYRQHHHEVLKMMHQSRPHPSPMPAAITHHA